MSNRVYWVLMSCILAIDFLFIFGAVLTTPVPNMADDPETVLEYSRKVSLEQLDNEYYAEQYLDMLEKQ